MASDSNSLHTDGNDLSNEAHAHFSAGYFFVQNSILIFLFNGNICVCWFSEPFSVPTEEADSNSSHIDRNECFNNVNPPAG